MVTLNPCFVEKTGAIPREIMSGPQLQAGSGEGRGPCLISAVLL